MLCLIHAWRVDAHRTTKLWDQAKQQVDCRHKEDTKKNAVPGGQTTTAWDKAKSYRHDTCEQGIGKLRLHMVEDMDLRSSGRENRGVTDR